MKVAPSILTADFLHLEKDIRMLNSCADYIHLDIMDGSFVPNISFGFPVVEAISKVATVPLDAHLMVVHPERWFKRLSELGVRMVSFHLEATGWKTPYVIKMARKCGLQVGLAINPDISIEKLYKYIGKVDFFLIMSVFAGFGGQKFIYQSVDRIALLKLQIERCRAKTLIEVDGGIGPDNAGALSKCGSDIVVAGSSVFSAEDPVSVVKALQEA